MSKTARDLLDELQNLLEKQIQMAQKGRFTDVDVLCEQTGILTKKITDCGIFESPEFKERRECLVKLYRKLNLIITAEKTAVSGQLSDLRKGRKMLQTYRSNI